jgi:hypothetical protein
MGERGRLGCRRQRMGRPEVWPKAGRLGRRAKSKPSHQRSCEMRVIATPQTTGVWISASSAIVLRWGPDGVAHRELIESLVPGRHRSTGRPPTADHPGGEGHRDERMRVFFARVAAAMSAEDDVLLVGDGEVVEHFAGQVRSHDLAGGITRRMELVKSGPITERQLLARMRGFAGSPAPRTLPD